VRNRQKEWDAFILYLEEHPGAFDKHERAGIKWAAAELKRLQNGMSGIEKAFELLDRIDPEGTL
jgi:hypothetical protein